ncbi:MAG: hypothetical protein LBB87_02415 [Nitrososphaerota archaeon]|nr:hypothetical protein [Nitrososphaerota archaeon]
MLKQEERELQVDIATYTTDAQSSIALYVGFFAAFFAIIGAALPYSLSGHKCVTVLLFVVIIGCIFGAILCYNIYKDKMKNIEKLKYKIQRIPELNDKITIDYNGKTELYKVIGKQINHTDFEVTLQLEKAEATATDIG